MLRWAALVGGRDHRGEKEVTRESATRTFTGARVRALGVALYLLPLPLRDAPALFFDSLDSEL